jgi:hypothetical protein
MTPEVERARPDAAGILAATVQHGRELMRAEFALAKAEFKHEISQVQAGVAAIAFGVTVAGVSLIVALVALAMQLELRAWVIASAAGGFVIAGAIAALWGWRQLAVPRLKRTRSSLERGLRGESGEVKANELKAG